MNIKEWREAHDISQSKLAELLPIKIRTLQDWESTSPKGNPPAYFKRALESLAQELASTENPQDTQESVLELLSPETQERISKLISDHGYKSESSVLESAVETLYTIVSKSAVQAQRPADRPCDICHKPVSALDAKRNAKGERGHKECFAKRRAA